MVDLLEVPKPKLKEELLKLRKSGYALVGVEQTHTSVPLDQHSAQTEVRYHVISCTSIDSHGFVFWHGLRWNFSENTAILLGAMRRFSLETVAVAISTFPVASLRCRKGRH